MTGLLRRLLIAADMESYSLKDAPTQYQAQQEFTRVLDIAIREAGFDPDQWIDQRAGDSVLAVLSADAAEPVVIGKIARRIDELLRQYNRNLVASARIRVRIAVHEGLIQPAPNGYAGDAVNLVARLRDSQEVRDVFAAFPEASVALSVSTRIYEDVVAPQYEGIRKDRFRQVRVVAKHDEQIEAWVSVIDEDISGASGKGPDPAKPKPEDNAAPAPGGGFHVENVRSRGAMAIGNDSRAHNNDRGAS